MFSIAIAIPIDKFDALNKTIKHMLNRRIDIQFNLFNIHWHTTNQLLLQQYSSLFLYIIKVIVTFYANEAVHKIVDTLLFEQKKRLLEINLLDNECNQQFLFFSSVLFSSIIPLWSFILHLQKKSCNQPMVL